MTIEEVRLEVDGHIATITLNRPAKLNAVTPEMSAALVDANHSCDHTPAIRVIVVTGAGERSFSVGSDIRELDRCTTPWDFRNRTDYCDAIRAPRRSPR